MSITLLLFQERLKREEELDRQLREREKKEKAATKRKHMEIRFFFVARNVLIVETIFQESHKRG